RRAPSEAGRPVRIRPIQAAAVPGRRWSGEGLGRGDSAAWLRGMNAVGMRELLARWAGSRSRRPKARHVMKGHTDVVRCLAFAPDGRRLASGSSDESVRIWDMATGRQQAVLHGHTGWVIAAAFTPDGQALASAGSDRVVQLWDLGAGRELASFPR